MRRTAWMFAALVAVGCMDEGAKNDRPKPEAKPSGAEGGAKGEKGEKPADMKPAAKLTTADFLKKNEECMASMMAKDDAKLAACYTDDAKGAIVDAPGMEWTGGKAIVEGLYKAWSAAIPDFTPQPQLVVANGNQMVAVMWATGTNSGPMMGMPPSNKKVSMLGARYVVFADDGRMKEDWHLADMTTVMAQIGAMGKKPPMPVRIDEKPLMEKPEIVVATDSKTENDNVAMIKKANDAYVKGDTKALGEFLTDDFTYVDNTMPGEMKGKAANLKGIDQMSKAFSDRKWDEKALFGAGDFVASVGTFSATNTGDMPMMKLKKTGKTVSLTGINIFHITAGKIDKMWAFGNGFAFATQMGLVKMPAAPAGGEAPAAPAEGEKPAGGEKPMKKKAPPTP
jgi:predicted ester cyclase